jgi:hypothetical protein
VLGLVAIVKSCEVVRGLPILVPVDRPTEAEKMRQILMLTLVLGWFLNSKIIESRRF